MPVARCHVEAIGVAPLRHGAHLGRVCRVYPVAQRDRRGVSSYERDIQRRHTLNTHQGTTQTSRSLSKGGGQLKARHAEQLADEQHLL
jgi:hypothetical protein